MCSKQDLKEGYLVDTVLIENLTEVDASLGAKELGGGCLS